MTPSRSKTAPTNSGWIKTTSSRCRESKKEPYTIVMPPPNITGQLHMGHAMDCTLQDALTRYHRMKGDPTLWLPGTDHASIATEVKVVEKLAKEGIKKQDIGREEFLKHAWDWKKEYGGRISRQLRRMGASCDWSRERFTMDEGCSRAVREVFVSLYEQGLIYPRQPPGQLVPHLQYLHFSDAEVEYEEQDGSFWHLLYHRQGDRRACWSWPPPAPKPCWAIPPWPSTRRGSPLRPPARLPCHPAPAESVKSPSSAMSTPIWKRAPAS